MEPYLGQIQAFGFNFAPRGWAKCDGAILPISSNTALFSLLGTTFGGDGRSTFALPDLRGRSIVHIGNGPGLDAISWGEKSGAFQRHITTQNLPSHNHNVSVSVSAGPGEESNPTGYISNHANAFNEEPTTNARLSGINQTSAGENSPMNIRNPFLGINVCIALQGVYPSRS